MGAFFYFMSTKQELPNAISQMYFFILSLFLSSEANQTLTENTFIDFLALTLQQITERDQLYH